MADQLDLLISSLDNDSHLAASEFCNQLFQTNTPWAVAECGTWNKLLEVWPRHDINSRSLTIELTKPVDSTVFFLCARLDVTVWQKTKTRGTYSTTARGEMVSAAHLKLRYHCQIVRMDSWNSICAVLVPNILITRNKIKQDKTRVFMLTPKNKVARWCHKKKHAQNVCFKLPSRFSCIVLLPLSVVVVASAVAWLTDIIVTWTYGQRPNGDSLNSF